MLSSKLKAANAVTPTMQTRHAAAAAANGLEYLLQNEGCVVMLFCFFDFLFSTFVFVWISPFIFCRVFSCNLLISDSVNVVSIFFIRHSFLTVRSSP